MEIITSLEQQVAAARHLLDGVPEGESLPGFLQTLPDDGVLAVLEIGAALVRLGQRLEVPASGVVAQRSTRSRGQAGIAQSRGHRDAASLLQQITGVSRTQATREVKVGESLVQAAGASQLGSATGGDGGLDLGELGTGFEGNEASDDILLTPWHTPLDRAVDVGDINPEQYTAIRQGLGEPPAPTEADVAAVLASAAAGGGCGTESESDDETEPVESAAPEPQVMSEYEALQRATAFIHAAWRLATVSLLSEAKVRSLDELRKACRNVRDELDPAGCERRFADRYAARSFRLWVDDKGQHRGTFAFDDESAAWLRSVVDGAMRPRRGGPTFVDPSEQTAAAELRDDPRSNEQLVHDLLMDVLRSGTLAQASEVLGARQAGVRVVQVVDVPGNDHAFLENDGTPVPVGVADRTVCNTGIVPVTVDRDGNPLNVGREQRLYSPKQRIALSLRDGGCRWTNCDRPANYCEAHHIDEWAADHGRTDIDRGILLCRYHHMELHNSGWKITRGSDSRSGDGCKIGAGNPAETGTGSPFMLHPPGRRETPIELPIRVVRAYAWGAVPKLSVRFRPGQSAPPQPVPPDAWGGRRPLQQWQQKQQQQQQQGIESRAKNP